jgi:hypothetical protein
MVMHSYNTNMQVEAGGTQIPGQLGYIETLFLS